MVDSTDGQTGRYKAYPEYKDSGLVWMGKIPSHWEQTKFKWVFKEKKKVSNFSLPAGSISFGEVIYKNEDNLSPDTKASYQEVLKGEFLINPLNLNFDLKSLRIALSKIDVVVSTGYIILQYDGEINKKYLRWLLYEFDVAHMKRLGSGVRQTINYTDIGNSLFSYPAQSEQLSIANFLDHETAKIDILIEKQQRLIELLTEKRQAVISHAVTKGLNPDVPMKDSGVDWVDIIPVHWKSSKLGYWAIIGNGATPFRENMSFWMNGTVPWLNSSKINDVIVKEAEQFITPLAKIKTSVQPIRENDLLIAITGEGQTRGRVAISKLEATINQHLASIRIVDNNEINYEYLYFWLDSNYERIRFESSGAGSTKGAITCGDINSYPVLLPPLHEQKKIVEYLKSENTVFDSLSEKAQRAIQLMQERRTALISSAVTGKIDVRDWVNSNPINND